MPNLSFQVLTVYVPSANIKDLMSSPLSGFCPHSSPDTVTCLFPWSWTHWKWMQIGLRNDTMWTWRIFFTYLDNMNVDCYSMFYSLSSIISHLHYKQQIHLRAVFLKKCWAFLTTLRGKKKQKKMEGCNKITEVKNKTIPCCPLVIYAFTDPGGALSHLCRRRQMLPQLLLSWVSQPHPSLWRFFLFLLQHLLFFQPLPPCAILPSLLFSHFDCMYLSLGSSG